MQNKILKAREERYKLATSFDKIVIIIKANTPGEKKNLWFSNLLVNIFTNIITKELNTTYSYYKSDDGNYTLLNLKSDNYIDIKKYLVNLEETYTLGRFIDLDLYYNKEPISRTSLDLTTRKCFICGKPAYLCARNKTHKLEELLDVVEKSVTNYLNDYIIETLKTAIITELDLDYKFGLVEKANKHSHPDMDYNLMMSSLNYISPMFKSFITLGFKNLNAEDYFNKARQVGLEIENKMLYQTNNINTYKGLIFIMALLITSLSITIYNNHSFNNIFNIVKTLTQNIYDDFKIKDNTFGKIAYEKYNIKGIRKEAYLGFPSVRKMLEIYSFINSDNLRSILIDLIIEAEDTTLLKRAKSLENYNSIKQKFQDLNKANLKDIKLLHNKMVNDNISFGGAADLLIGTIFLYKIKNHLFLV